MTRERCGLFGAREQVRTYVEIVAGTGRFPQPLHTSVGSELGPTGGLRQTEQDIPTDDPSPTEVDLTDVIDVPVSRAARGDPHAAGEAVGAVVVESSSRPSPGSRP